MNKLSIFSSFVLACFGLCPSVSFAQCTMPFDTITIPASLMVNYAPRAGERDSILDTETDWHDLTDDLPAGYVTDGSVSYTSYLQNGINNYDHVKMPDFPVMLSLKSDASGLTLRSNMKVYFQENSKLILRPTGQAAYEILRVHEIDSTTIYFANIQGDKYVHPGTLGESGMGISIKNSTNITVLKPIVKRCWGDGIYIGRIGTNSPSSYNSNININYAILDDNRRNGLTIASGDNVAINDIICSNTNGKAPEVGIDLEPARYNDTLSRITFNRPRTFNNKSTGFVFYPQQLLSTSSRATQEVSIEVLDPFDSLSCKSMSSYLSFIDTKPTILNGFIRFYFPRWISPRSGIHATVKDDAGENNCALKIRFLRILVPIVGTRCAPSNDLYNALLDELSPFPDHVTVECY